MIDKYCSIIGLLVSIFEYFYTNKMRRGSTSILKQNPTQFSYSHSRVSSISKMSESRISQMSQVSNKSQINHNKLQSSISSTAIKLTNNLQNSYKPSKQLLPPRRIPKEQPYFSSLSKEEIYCVICKKSYSTSDLQVHLILHKQSQQQLASSKVYSFQKDPSASKFQAQIPPLKSQSISKFKSSTINNLATNSFSIAATIPASEKIILPTPTTIFHPRSLCIASQDQQHGSYQQLYLNPQKNFTIKSSPYFRNKVGHQQQAIQSNTQFLFDAMSIKSGRSQYNKMMDPYVVYDRQLQKWKDNRKTSSGDYSQISDVKSFMRGYN